MAVITDRGLYINVDGMETFLKNIKDISDTFDTIQNKLDQIYSTLETDFDGITPKILETAQSCAGLAKILKRNANYIHEQSKSIVTIAENSEISALAVFDKLEALKQRLAKLLASVGKAVIPWIGGVSVLPQIGDILKDIGNNFGGIGHGGGGYSSQRGSSGGGHSIGGGRHLDDGTSGINHWEHDHGNANGIVCFSSETKWFDGEKLKYDFDKEKFGLSIGLVTTSGAAAVWAAGTSGSGNIGGYGLEGSASVKGPNAEYEAGLEINKDGLKGTVSGKANLASASAEGKITDSKGNSVSGKVGVDAGYAEGKASLTAGPGGVMLEAEAEVGVARATAGLTVEPNSVLLNEVSVSGEASFATASASGKVGATAEDGFVAKGEAEASLGKVTGTGEVKILGGIITLKGTAGVNVGVGAKGTAEFGPKTTIGGELGAGIDLGFEITIDNEAIVSAAKNAYKEVKNTVVSAVNEVADIGAKAAKQAGKAINSAKKAIKSILPWK